MTLTRENLHVGATSAGGTVRPIAEQRKLLRPKHGSKRADHTPEPEHGDHEPLDEATGSAVIVQLNAVQKALLNIRTVRGERLSKRHEEIITTMLEAVGVLRRELQEK